MKTLQSPKASPGKASTPKKVLKAAQADPGKISPSKSVKSERSEKSQPKSDKSARKDGQLLQQIPSPGDKQNQALKHIEMKQLKQLNLRLAASARKYSDTEVEANDTIPFFQ